jgi:hypothetical protein
MACHAVCHAKNDGLDPDRSSPHSLPDVGRFQITWEHSRGLSAKDDGKEINLLTNNARHLLRYCVDAL